jgi:tRNA A-37 threonylcarbamoyl transferase component Bud32
MTKLVSNNVFKEERILKLCNETVDSREIFAACFYGPRVYGYADEKADINVLLIISNYPTKMSTFTKQLNSIKLSILAIDQKVFESDVTQGQFGEFIAEIIALPYQPWINPSYLKKMEVKMKKRFVLELLKSIIWQYPELSMELLIKPEYFMYEVIRKRAKLFPPLMYSFFNIFARKVRKQNINFIMRGYLKALKELEKENYVTLSGGYIKIDKDFIETTKRQRTTFSNILTSIQKALLPYIRGVSAKITTAFLQDQKFSTKDSKQRTEEELLKQLEETEKYLLMPTPLGPVPFSDKTDIQDFVRKTVPGGERLKITIEEMGGVLNSVFLLQLQRNHETQKVVVKKFEDWLGFKWFPLALWTFGTKKFAVLGKTRLEREYSINQFLSKHGFNVPRILYVSLKKRLIFEEFVEGEKLSRIVKRTIVFSSKEDMIKSRDAIKRVGKEIAKAHSFDIALGDCKPENILLTEDEKICFLDLEQATRNGNQSWDIAEFLYYSGHYILPTHSDKAAKIIATSFIEGYLEAGGKREIVEKAASAKYTKVFSIFTLPHILLIMANICKKMGEEKSNE